MTVDEYEQKFTYLAQFAKGFLPIERARCKRFEDGLRVHIKDKIYTLAFDDFQRLIDAARRVECTSFEHRRLKEERQQSKKRTGSLAGPIRASESEICSAEV